MLTELAVATRADRCYAVDLDVRGEHMAVGGRDKKVAVYRYASDAGSLELVWEQTSEVCACTWVCAWVYAWVCTWV